MAYTKTNWIAGSTVVRAVYMNKIEDKLASLDSDKVDKIQGKALSSNDYTNEEKAKLASVPDNVSAQLADKVQILKIKNKIVNGEVPSTILNAVVNRNYIKPDGTIAQGNPAYTTSNQIIPLIANNKYFAYITTEHENTIKTSFNYGFRYSDGTNQEVSLSVVSGKELYGIFTPQSTLNAMNYFVSNAVPNLTKVKWMLIDMTTLGIPEFTQSEMLKIIRTVGYFEGEHGLTQAEALKITLSLMRENRNAIIALGGTIV